MRRFALGLLNIEALIACAFTIFFALFALSFKATILYILGWFIIAALHCFSAWLNVSMLIHPHKYFQKNLGNSLYFIIAIIIPNLFWLHADLFNAWLNLANKYGFNY
ncbi:MAG: hypothetical protein U1E36_00350 [Rickettsiales bacterium]